MSTQRQAPGTTQEQEPLSMTDLHEDHEAIGRQQKRQFRLDLSAWGTVILGLVVLGWNYTTWAASAHEENSNAAAQNTQAIKAISGIMEDQRRVIEQLRTATAENSTATARVAEALSTLNRHLDRIDGQLDRLDKRIRDEEMR